MHVICSLCFFQIPLLGPGTVLKVNNENQQTYNPEKILKPGNTQQEQHPTLQLNVEKSRTGKENQDTISYRCQLCGTQYSNHAALNSPIDEVHMMRISLDLCNRQFASSQTFMTHR